MELELDLVLIDPRASREAGVNGSETLLRVDTAPLFARRLGSQTSSPYEMSWKGIMGDRPKEERGLRMREGFIGEYG